MIYKQVLSIFVLYRYPAPPGWDWNDKRIYYAVYTPRSEVLNFLCLYFFRVKMMPAFSCLYNELTPFILIDHLPEVVLKIVASMLSREDLNNLRLAAKR